MKHNPGYSKIEGCLKEGWEVDKDGVWAYGERFPLVDPLSIHLKTYRVNPSHETRYQAMVRAFEILWPKQVKTYNYWMERIFREHCNFNTEIFTLAAGGGIGKTQSAAYMANIFWLALPHKRAVVVTSTTLPSLKKRIYGFILRALKECSIADSLKININNSPPPYVSMGEPDFIHGIFGVAAKEGPEDKAIKDIIGHHPKNAFLLILDEAPDMPIAILGAIPNLKKALEDRFQAVAIGNSNSWTDLHGILSTPKIGIDNIDPAKDFRWETTYPGGICLYFNPYDSPAIHEPDPIKKAHLSTFLMTEEKLIAAERDEGTDSESFWRMTMGFWRKKSTEPTIVSESFLKDYDPTQTAEFSGKYPIHVCAGLDPAFSTGGDKCILRLGVLGHHVNGKMVLDLRGTHFVFHIKILANTGKSAEIQIADQVIEICKTYNVPLNTLCVDASGQGRGLADVIQLRSQTGMTPTKIYSTNIKTQNNKTFDIVISSAHEMWFKGREFISQGQLFGLDQLAYGQLHTRKVIEDKNGKRVLERKEDYKKRMAALSSLLGRSPDEADAAMLCLQSAIIHYGFFPGQKLEVVRYESEDHRQLDVAIKAYQAKMSQGTFNLKAGYTKGIESLLKKKMF